MEKVMIYPIVVFGAPVLREKCREIGPDYPEVKKLIEDMFLTLEEAEGVGLAAPQIGKSIRLFIVDCTPWGEDHPELADYRRAFINPEIYEVSEETKLYEEGCAGIARERAAFACDPDALSGREFRAARRRVHRAASLGDPARI